MISISNPQNPSGQTRSGEELREQGYGGLYGVGKAAEFPPALVTLTYNPSAAAQEKIALVGKGLTFDSGGYNLKVGASQIEMMKYDMGGSAAVLGAAKALGMVLPKLKGKLDGTAIRVPTPNVSLAILKLSLNNATSVQDMNATMRDAALKGSLVNQINYQVDPELVSTDIIGNSCCSVFDSNATLVTDEGQDVVLYVWYDNEFGYTKQVIRLAKLIAKVRRLTYY